MRSLLIGMSIASVAGGVSASSMVGSFDWTGNGGDDFWTNPANWSGPANQYPQTVLDTATLSLDFTEILVDQNIALGGLTVNNGADVFTFGHSVFVDGLTLLEETGSSIVIRESPALRDFDTDGLHIRENGQIWMYEGAVLQVDDYLLMQTGMIAGDGIVELDDTAANITMQDAAFWAYGSGDDASEGLTLRRVDGSTSRLNWTDSESVLSTWTDSTMNVEIPYTGALGGKISVFRNGTFNSTDGIITANSAEIDMNGGNVGVGQPARLNAPWFNINGHIEASRDVRIDTNQSLISSTIELISSDESMTRLLIDSDDWVIVDRITATATGANTQIIFNGDPMNIAPGDTSQIVLNEDSAFDLDGQSGTRTVNIPDGAGLRLRVEDIDTNDQTQRFGGVINLGGLLNVEEMDGHTLWESVGQINIDGGVLEGRMFRNSGTFIGTGSTETTFFNDGVLEADGGTLWINGPADLDGYFGDEAGQVRAITGDIVFGETDTQSFTGTMTIGDGQGQVREVIDLHAILGIADSEDGTGALLMNSGRLRATHVSLEGILEITGLSQIRGTGGDPLQGVEFDWSGINTINGTLELEGDTWISNGAAFLGEGTLLNMNTNDFMDLDFGADTSDVSIDVLGTLTMNDDNGPDTGLATVAGVTLHSTSELLVHLEGTNPGDGFDALNVHDVAVLDGDLVVSMLNDWEPMYGDSFTIVDAGSVVGSFDSFSVTGLEQGHGMSVEITDTKVILHVTCPPDIAEANGIVDVNDLLMLLANWGTDGPGAAIAAPMDVADVNDLLALLAAWGSC